MATTTTTSTSTSSSSSTSSNLTNGQVIMDYTIVKSLSKSGRSEVFLASNKKGKKFVIKKINKLANGVELIANEIEAGKVLRHPGIAKFYAEFQDEEYAYLVFQFIKGEDLFQYLSKNSFEQPMKEKEAKKVIRQLVASLLYCHQQGFVHHDLKLENVILTEEKKMAVKLIDFGLCERLAPPSSPSLTQPQQMKEAKLSTSFCGSHDYVPPEILKRMPYCGFKADCWGLGTLLYILMYGELPFSFQVRSKAVVKGKSHPKVDFADHRNPNVSEAAKELITAMLTEDPNARISLNDVARHRWLAKEKKSTFSFLLKRVSTTNLKEGFPNTNSNNGTMEQTQPQQQPQTQVQQS